MGEALSVCVSDGAEQQVNNEPKQTVEKVCVYEEFLLKFLRLLYYIIFCIVSCGGTEWRHYSQRCELGLTASC